MDSKYHEALDWYEKGNYAKAIEAMAQSSTTDEETYRQFVLKCQSLMAQPAASTDKPAKKIRVAPNNIAIATAVVMLISCILCYLGLIPEPRIPYFNSTVPFFNAISDQISCSISLLINTAILTCGSIVYIQTFSHSADGNFWKTALITVTVLLGLPVILLITQPKLYDIFNDSYIIHLLNNYACILIISSFIVGLYFLIKSKKNG